MRKPRLQKHKIIEKIKAEKKENSKYSIYLSKSVYEKFAEICAAGKVPVSKVIEELMKSFIESEATNKTDK
jgi:hypothetical protein